MKRKRKRSPWERLKSGPCITVPLHFFREFPKGQAILLAYLAGLDTDEEGWAVCPSEQIEDDLDMSAAIQTRLLKWLEEWEYLEIARAGFPAQRHVKVDIQALASQR